MADRQIQEKYWGGHARNGIAFCIGIAIICALFWHLNKNSEIIDLFSRVSIIKVLSICLVGFFVNTISMSITQQIMTSKLECRLNGLESYALSVITRVGNTLTPFRMGTIYRVIYLKKNHNLSLIQFGSMFLSLQLILVFTGCLVSAVSLAILSFKYQHINIVWVLCFSTIFILSWFLLFHPVHRIIPIKWIGDKINQFVEGWQALQHEKHIFWIGISGRLVSLIVYTFIFQTVLGELGYKTGWLECLLFASVTSLCMLIQVIPGSLGITETVVTVTAVLFLIPSAAGFSASLLIRLVNIFFLVLFALPAWLFLNRFRKVKKKSPQEQIEGCL